MHRWLPSKGHGGLDSFLPKSRINAQTWKCQPAHFLSPYCALPPSPPVPPLPSHVMAT